MVSIVCVDDFAATILIMSCCYLYADAFLCIFTSRIPNGNCDKYVVGTPFGQVIVTRPTKRTSINDDRILCYPTAHSTDRTIHVTVRFVSSNLFSTCLIYLYFSEMGFSGSFQSFLVCIGPILLCEIKPDFRQNNNQKDRRGSSIT